MTDDELIVDWYERFPKDGLNPEQAKNWDRLIALARIGAAVKAAPEGFNEKHGRLMP